MLKVIISPAKKMNITEDAPRGLTVPVFLDRALELHAILKGKSLAELKTIWKCSDRLAEQNLERLHMYSPELALTPALLSYEGIQYQHMAPGVFTDSQWDYAVSHLRILSGFYGILTPTDKVIPYRLEMQAKLQTGRGRDLYGWWGDTLYRELLHGGTTELVNLASAEYSKAVLPWLEQHRAPACVTCVFGELSDGRVKVKGTQAKIARGEMVRWMAENQITRAADIRDFDSPGWQYREDLSTDSEYVFVRQRGSDLL